jgi:hypothetical protein
MAKRSWPAFVASFVASPIDAAINLVTGAGRRGVRKGLAATKNAPEPLRRTLWGVRADQPPQDGDPTAHRTDR